MNIPSVEALDECFDYNPDSGSLKWKSRPRHHFKTEGQMNRVNRRFAGTEALNAEDDNGYRVGTLFSRPQRKHIVIWKMMTGYDPEKLIDHRDRNKSNNKWSNLRSADEFQNRTNTGISKQNTSGYVGVSKHQGKWRVYIMHHGDNMYLGHFEDKEEAAEAYRIAAIRYHGDFRS